MKFLVAGAVAAATLSPAVLAQQTPAPAAAQATAAKFGLDTPIETLLADANAKSVLDTDIPGLSSHPALDQFKAMSLRAVQPLSQGALTDEMLKKVETDLAALR